MIFTCNLQMDGCVTSQYMQLTAVNNTILFDGSLYYYWVAETVEALKYSLKISSSISLLWATEQQVCAVRWSFLLSEGKTG